MLGLVDVQHDRHFKQHEWGNTPMSKQRKEKNLQKLVRVYGKHPIIISYFTMFHTYPLVIKHGLLENPCTEWRFC